MDPIERLLAAHAIARQDPAAADSICRDVLEQDPSNPFALYLLGVLVLQSGRSGDAVELLHRATSGRPQHIETRVALAEALARTGDDDRAAAVLGGIVAQDPGHAPALAALAMVRLRRGDAAGALTAAERARAVAPLAASALLAHGTALSALHRPHDAEGLLVEAVARDPGNASAHLNLANVLLDLDNVEEAESHLRRASVLDPNSAETWASLGFLLAGIDRLEEAVAACDAAIRLRPDFAQAYWNRSFAKLRAGDFVAGWADYEWRHKHPQFGRGTQMLPGEQWDGGDLAGCRLLVSASQGLGDTIQLARYLPLLVERGAEVILLCPPPLLRLLRQLPVRVVSRGSVPPEYDKWVDQMSLPRLFGTQPDTIPMQGAYLRAEPAAPGTFQGSTAEPVPGTLPASAGARRVGLTCAGNPAHSNDFRRSMGPADLARLRDAPGVAYTSLQVGPSSAALAALFGVPDLSRELIDFAATAQVVAGLDLVITVDTAVAHLAGALGVPVWILLPRAPDWRWLAGRDTSPWYGSARLFRQERAGDWTGVITQVTEALRTL